jgi:hypothetical protein
MAIFILQILFLFSLLSLSLSLSLSCSAGDWAQSLLYARQGPFYKFLFIFLISVSPDSISQSNIFLLK